MAERRHSSAGKRQMTGKRTQRKNRAAARRADRRFFQLMVCGGIFVLLVAVKLLLPDQMTRLNRHLSVLLEQNMDVQAVFSAVGRAISGETEDLAEEVYQAVFRPEVAGETVQTAALPDLEELDASRQLRLFLRDRELQRQESGVPETQAEALSYIQYSQENLPENVNMAQDLLGFDYCTPVMGALSSDFGYRDHPTEGEERFHYGLDIAAETGTAISCFADGTVTAVGDSSSYGKYLIVAHEGDYTTLYAHCSTVTASSGAAVKAGEKIAEVGETGMATGPHLHFELHRDGEYLNPIYYVSLA